MFLEHHLEHTVDQEGNPPLGYVLDVLWAWGAPAHEETVEPQAGRLLSWIPSERKTRSGWKGDLFSLSPGGAQRPKEEYNLVPSAAWCGLRAPSQTVSEPHTNTKLCQCAKEGAEAPVAASRTAKLPPPSSLPCVCVRGCKV